MKGRTTVTRRSVERRLTLLAAWAVLCWLLASLWGAWAVVPGKDVDPAILALAVLAGVFAVVCAVAAVTVVIVRWVTR